MLRVSRLVCDNLELDFKDIDAGIMMGPPSSLNAQRNKSSIAALRRCPPHSLDFSAAETIWEEVSKKLKITRLNANKEIVPFFPLFQYPASDGEDWPVDT